MDETAPSFASAMRSRAPTVVVCPRCCGERETARSLGVSGCGAYFPLPAIDRKGMSVSVEFRDPSRTSRIGTSPLFRCALSHALRDPSRCDEQRGRAHAVEVHPTQWHLFRSSTKFHLIERSLARHACVSHPPTTFCGAIRPCNGDHRYE